MTEDEDIAPERVLHYCPACDEEYMLPEGITRCPVCGCEHLEEIV